MNIRILKNQILFIAVLFLASCGEDESVPLGAYESGVFVVNEGNFGTDNASISHYDPNGMTATQTIFNAVTGNVLGEVAQSISIHGDQAFLSINNSNKIEVVNANTFESSYVIEALLPRYFIVHDNKGYLTEWVSFIDNGRVSIINLTTGDTESSITVGAGAENLIVSGDKLFVSNNFENTVSAIDLSTNQVAGSIPVGNSPGEFAEDSDGNLWLICGGGFDSETFAPLNNGTLYKINSTDLTITQTINLETNLPRKLAINVSGNSIFYISGSSVYSVSKDADTKPSSAFIDIQGAVSLYGIEVNPANDEIYIGDSKGFQGNGSVYRYSNTGTLIDNFDVGIGPNGFAFK